MDFELKGSVVIFLILEGTVSASSKDLELVNHISILKFEIRPNCVRRSNSNRTLNTDGFYINDQPVNAL